MLYKWSRKLNCSGCCCWIPISTHLKWLATCKFQDWASNDMISGTIFFSLSFWFESQLGNTDTHFVAFNEANKHLLKMRHSSSLPFNWMNEKENVGYFENKVMQFIYLFGHTQSQNFRKTLKWNVSLSKYNIYDLPFCIRQRFMRPKMDSIE